ncbi:MAG: GTP-binding protein [Saprospiraceae bacterium]|jgi:GTP-binding protein
MKFVDEATVRVAAGKGGNGSMSFRREKYIPRGGPDGGNGGRGGDVYFVGNSGLNTLADFRYIRDYRAEHGARGEGRQKSGKAGSDLFIRVPLGTLVYDEQTLELIGEVVENDQQLLVAQGGQGGLGNTHFKSSVNRAPRRTVPGSEGDERKLKVELKVLADVGLLGFPNAGKSTLLSAVSQARPKVANYPFTTLHPELGVVDIGSAGGFVIADIPGLIEGAADGVGLGIGFLKHLQRTGLLLHVVDVVPVDEDQAPVIAIKALVNELQQFDQTLYEKPRWIVLNKIDVADEDEVQAVIDQITAELDWHDPIYTISAVTGEGCKDLMSKISQYLRELRGNDPHAIEDDEPNTEIENES